MPKFTISLSLKGGDKSQLDAVTEELRGKGARILDIQSKVGNIGDPPMPVNLVTITYEAKSQIFLR